MRQGYIGTEPELPSPSSPNIIKNLFFVFNKIEINGIQLFSKPQIIEVGMGKKMAELIQAPERLNPILVICHDPSGLQTEFTHQHN